MILVVAFVFLLFFGKVAASCCLHISHFSLFHCFAAWSMMIRNIHTYIAYIFMHIMIIFSLRVVFVFCVSGTRRWISFAWPPLKARIVCKFQVSMRTLNCEGNPGAIRSGSDWSYPSRGMQDKGISSLHLALCQFKYQQTLNTFWLIYYIVLYSKSCHSCCCFHSLYSCLRAKAT